MPNRHPLEPLTGAEVETAVDLLRSHGKLRESSRIISIVLKEPTKQVVYSLSDAHPPVKRSAVATIFDSARNLCSVGVICLTDRNIVSFRDIPGVQPLITPDEMVQCEQAVIGSQEFRAKLNEHFGSDGWKAEDLIVDVWSAGFFGEEEEGEIRLARPICFFRDPETRSPYARPIEGLRPVVDLNRMEVIRVEDYGKWPLPPPHFCAYESAHIQKLREDVKSLEIVQKDGPSFTVVGNRVKWQNWDLVVGFNAKEGLTLHDVRVNSRTVLYRASLSEMVIPYGDPAHQQARKNAFDVSDYGIGMCANSLKLGCDCLGTIHYFDAHLVGSSGQPWTLTNAVCMHEEDFSLIWKHFDRHANVNETRRSRRLVISFIATIENYDYAFYWYLYQDGNIEFEVKLTGFLSVGVWREEDGQPKYGKMVAPMLYAPYHLHFFNMRLDFAIDGVKNCAYRVDVFSEDAESKFKNAFYAQKTLLTNEKAARDHVNVATSRTWEIANQNARNALGEPVAYKLIAGDNLFPRGASDAWWRKRAGFVDYHVWVTPFDENEFCAAGEYPNQHPGGDGLPLWTEKDRSLENEDLVVWYTFGVTHITRPEDYPVMPVVRLGFLMKPNGFFDWNPAFDVPPQALINKDTGASKCCT